MAIGASLPSVAGADRALAAAPRPAPEPAPAGLALAAAALRAVTHDMRAGAGRARAAHSPISLPSARAPTSTRREIAPARSPWASDNGARVVLRMLMTSRMKAPNAAPDRKMIMPNTAMIESAEIIRSPQGIHGWPGSGRYVLHA